MWREAGVSLGVFAITSAETVLATLESRADRQSTMAGDDRFARRAAAWSGLFELVLIVDMYAVAAEGIYVALPAVLAAVLSKYLALEKRRQTFRTKGLNRGARRRATQDDTDDDE